MKPHLIVDYGDASLSALLIGADGDVVPWSQEIQQMAARFVSPAILFDPRVVEHADFIWEDAIETLSKASAATFFPRARRIGIRRPWDPQAWPESLQLASPLALLSSPAALADRTIATVLPRVAGAMLEALLDPILAAVREKDSAAAIIVPSRTGARARLLLRHLFRRRGFREVTIVRREIAAAMSLISQTPCACIVAESSKNDLILHRVDLGGEPAHPRFRSSGSVTIENRGWIHWSSAIAGALHDKSSTAFERSLATLLTGSPDSLPPRMSHAALHAALTDDWIAGHSIAAELREPLAALEGQNLPLLFAGEIFTLAAVREAFGVRALQAPPLEGLAQNVSRAMRSRFAIAPPAALRIATLGGRSTPLLTEAQFPAPGETCRTDADFAVRGATKSFIVQILLGDATLCALPLPVSDGQDVRLTVQLRRTASRLHGTLEARAPRNVVAARCRFSDELEVIR